MRGQGKGAEAAVEEMVIILGPRRLRWDPARRHRGRKARGTRRRYLVDHEAVTVYLSSPPFTFCPSLDTATPEDVCTSPIQRSVSWIRGVRAGASPCGSGLQDVFFLLYGTKSAYKHCF